MELKVYNSGLWKTINKNLEKLKKSIGDVYFLKVLLLNQQSTMEIGI